MNLKFVAALSLTLVSTGCKLTKSSVCEGCNGPDLEECEFDYEGCDDDEYCRRGDLQHLYADDLCLYPEATGGSPSTGGSTPAGGSPAAPSSGGSASGGTTAQITATGGTAAGPAPGP